MSLRSWCLDGFFYFVTFICFLYNFFSYYFCLPSFLYFVISRLSSIHDADFFCFFSELIFFTSNFIVCRINNLILFFHLILFIFVDYVDIFFVAIVGNCAVWYTKQGTFFVKMKLKRKIANKEKHQRRENEEE